MKITIIGAGAMGCLFGGLLSEAGLEVRLLDIRPDQVRCLNTEGLSIIQDGRERIVRVWACTDPGLIEQTDLALIFVKHAQTETAAKTAAGLLKDSGHILTLQNGMGNAEIIARVAGPDKVICGTTAQGAMVLGPGRIQHSGTGKTILGMWGQELQPVARSTADLFSSAGIESETVDDIKPVLWNKLFANVGINAITALTGLRNGQLLDREPTIQLVRAAVEEAMEVARAHRVPVAEDGLKNVFAIAEATGPNRSSMGQDVDRKRVTEIDAINGYIVRMAEEKGLEVPVNQTLTRLIRTVETHY